MTALIWAGLVLWLLATVLAVLLLLGAVAIRRDGGQK